MKRTARSILAAVFAVGICGLSLMAPAAAADLKPRMTTVPGLSLPFARTERAQAVWASSACQRATAPFESPLWASCRPR